MDDSERMEARDKKIEKIFSEYTKYCNTLFCLLGDDAKIIISDANVRHSLIRDLCKNIADGNLLDLGKIKYLELNFGLLPYEADKLELEIIDFHINISMFVEVEDVKKYLNKIISAASS